jgi:hypothetical protein
LSGTVFFLTGADSRICWILSRSNSTWHVRQTKIYAAAYDDDRKAAGSSGVWDAVPQDNQVAGLVPAASLKKRTQAGVFRMVFMA